LREVNGDLLNYGFETCYLTELQIVKNNFLPSDTGKNIVEVGNLMMGKYCEFEHLKKIRGIVNSGESFNYKSLEYIGYLINEKQKNSKLPSLKKIGHYVYNENDGYEDLADQIYFKVKDNLHITKNTCYIMRELSNKLIFQFSSSVEKAGFHLKIET
jgi:hypothetical protein